MGGKAEEAWGRYAAETDCVASMCHHVIPLARGEGAFPGFGRSDSGRRRTTAAGAC
jgi:hypothetical protein